VERNQLIAIVVIVVVIAGAGVAFIFLSQPTRPPEDTLIYETLDNPQHMDPHVNYESYGSWVHEQIYETLYYYPWGTADTHATMPLLASAAPIISGDGLNYTIPLRSDVTFSDGTPFNASCVKWNMERAAKIFAPDGPEWMIAEALRGGMALEDIAWGAIGPTDPAYPAVFLNWTANSGAITVLNETTILIRLEKPFAPFIDAFTYRIGSMISPTWAISHASDPAWATWDAYGVDYGEVNEYIDAHACGTGPYMLTEWLPNQYIHLTLNPNYWRDDSYSYAGSLKEIYIKTNDDQNGRALNLRAGTTDMTYWTIANAPDIWNYDTLTSSDPNIYVSTGGHSFTVNFFGFNQLTLNVSGVEIDSPFKWLEMRKAATYAFDEDAFLNASVNGFGFACKGPIPYGMFGYNGSAYTESYNLTAAQEWWNAAMQYPGFITAWNGLDDHLVISCNSGNVVREQGCLLLADGLTKMIALPGTNLTGLTKTPTFTAQVLEWANYLLATQHHQLPIFFVGWAPDYADADNYISPFGYSRGTFAGRQGYNDSQVDAWYLLAKNENNQTIRAQLYSWIEQRMHDEFPYLYILQGAEFRTWRAWVHGAGLNYNPIRSGVYFYQIYKDYSTT
jgi:peptide/nickel transport system substrate-binding protein